MIRYALLGVLLMGCGAMASREDDLNKTLIQFTEAVRWKKWQVAAAHVGPDIRQKWLQARLSGSTNLELADVNLRGVDRKGVNAQEATVFMGLTWYRLPDTTLQQSVWKQQWKHDRNGWKMVEETPLEAEPVVVPEPAPSWP